ncbi:MAG: FmdB family zinc ribbon protein [Microthrixaceae bacterium]
MPTYEYSCRDCGHGFEIQQAMSDDPLTTCPDCSGELRKVFHPVGIAFKGSGFYKNDARSGSGSGSGSSASKGTQDGSTESTSGSSSKDSPSKDTPSSDSPSKDTASKGSGSDSSKKPAVAAASD